MPTLARGETLDSKYEVLSLLDSGGMSELYKVRHIHLDEVRIVKVMRADLLADQSQQGRFRHEAKLATRVRHPNVANLHDFSQLPDGSYYMVWEFLDGETVQSWCQRNGFVPPIAAIDITLQLLDGLEAIHRAGIVHRDIAPDNIMLVGAQTPKDLRGVRVKIIDLGIAKSLELAHASEMRTETGTFIGKARYASPEQAGLLAPGESVDARSDLYSLGVTLFEMLTGRLPFDSSTTEGYLTKHLQDQPKTFQQAAPEVKLSESLEAVVSRSLLKNRNERFASAAEFRNAITQARQSILDSPDQDTRTNPRRRGSDHQAASASRSTEPEQQQREEAKPAIIPLDAPDSTPVPASVAAPDPTPVPASMAAPDSTPVPASVAAPVSAAIETASPQESAEQRTIRSPGRPAGQRNFRGPILWIAALLIAAGAFALWRMGSRAVDENPPVARTRSGATPTSRGSDEKPDRTASGDLVVSEAPLPPNVTTEIASSSDMTNVPGESEEPDNSADDGGTTIPSSEDTQPRILEAGQPTPVPQRPVSTPRPTPAMGTIVRPGTPAQAGEISESDAVRAVTSYVASRDYYNVPRSCLAARSLGYKNVGYTIEMHSRGCDEDRTLGRWRVDSRTREVFVQKTSGRYGRP